MANIDHIVYNETEYTIADAKARAMIAPAFDATQAYSAGQYVIYTDGKLYRLTADHAANAAWADTAKEEATVGADIAGLETDRKQFAEAAGQVVYYGADYDGSYRSVAIKRQGYDVWLNGTSDGAMKVRISGAVAANISSSYPNGWDKTIPLKGGHTYRLSNFALSGSSNHSERPIARVLDNNNNQFPGANLNTTSEFYVPQNINALIYLYLPNTLALTNLKVRVTLADITNAYKNGREVYVGSGGNDTTGSGTSTAPFATFAKALSFGDVSKIILKSDMYEALDIGNRDIRIEGNGYSIYGDAVLTTEAYESILKAPYAADERITACYVDGTTELTETVEGSSWKGPKYNIACFADDKKLLPVEDIATCEATENSFCWYDGDFYINAEGTRYSYVTTGKLVTVAGGRCVLNDLGVKHGYSYLVEATAASDVEMTGCAVIGSVNHSCIYCENGNLACRNVETAYCWNDGINTHGVGSSTIIDCRCHDCSDDGISQHSNTTGVIVGGEFWNCGKGGIASPVNSAKVDIYNAYCHDNDYGIYASASSGTAQAFSIFGCVVTGNRIGVNVAGHTARLHGNTISGNTGKDTDTESGGTITDLDA